MAFTNLSDVFSQIVEFLFASSVLKSYTFPCKRQISIFKELSANYYILIWLVALEGENAIYVF